MANSVQGTRDSMFDALRRLAPCWLGVLMTGWSCHAKPTASAGASPQSSAPIDHAGAVRRSDARSSAQPESARGRDPAPGLGEPTRRVRPPAVAGAFYPADRDVLGDEVKRLLAAAAQHELRGLRALISPHAGYRYSGPTAAIGYKPLLTQHFEHVVLLGPSHRVAFEGVALPDADAFLTPLGAVEIDVRARAQLLSTPFRVDATPHAREHSLEVQLPFLQLTLGRFSILPLVLGDADPAVVARRVAALVDESTLVIASSDLSHYYDYPTAEALDQVTVQAILALDIHRMQSREACGRTPILALMHLARARHWKPILLDRRNSGDTAGDRSRVVGYASIAFTDAP